MMMEHSRAKNEEVVIRVKHLRKNAGLTFDEKIDILNQFVANEKRNPNELDIVDGLNLGKFYNSLKKNRDKYQFFIDHIGALDEMEVEVEEEGEEAGEEITTAPVENEEETKAEVQNPVGDVMEDTKDDAELPAIKEGEKPKKNKKSKKSKKE